jgi:transposase InsO family protein
MTHIIRKPSPYELDTLDITWLTSASPWDPSSLNEDVTTRFTYLSELTASPVLGESTDDFEVITSPALDEPVDDIEDAIDLGEISDPELAIDQRLGTSHPIPRYEKWRPFLLHKPLQVIQKTFKATTRYASRIYGPHNMNRHFKSRFPILNRHRLHETFCTDTWFSSTTAIHGYTCAQIFYGTTSRYISCYPMHKEADGPNILEDFVRNDGAPFTLKSDNSQMQSSDAWMDICRKYNIRQSFTEPHHPHQNQAERSIQEVKRMVNSIMDKTGSPDNLWAFCTKYVVYILNRLAHPDLQWRTPLEKCFGDTPDISNVLHHCFFDKILYYCPNESFPATKEKLGRFIGFAENTGDSLTYIILTEDDEVLHRSVIRTASNNIRADPSDTIQKDRFLRLTDLTSSPCPTFTIDDVVNYDTTNPTRVEPAPETTDETQLIDDNVDPTYEQAMDDQDDDDNRLWKLTRILDYRDDHKKRELKVLWETGEVTWEPYGVIKQHAPLQVALFAERENLLNYDAWKWAKTYVRKHKRTIRILRAHYVKVQGRTYRFQFGIRIPVSISEALRLDSQNGNTLWRDAIDKEIDKIIDYEVFKPVDVAPEGYQRIPCHMVFAVKVDGRHKARLVAGGNFTLLDPGEDAYSSVAESTSIRLAMLAAQLNDLLGVSIDIENAYLHGLTKELVYTVLDSSYGPELAGKFLVVVKGLYGLKTSGARFHESLSDTLLSMGFRPCRADADLWMREFDDHLEYVIRYVDDLYIFSRSPATIVDKLREVYNLKGGSSPDYFLGADIKSYTDKDGRMHRAISAHTYIQNICTKIENLIKSPLKSYDSPMAPSDHPELDDTNLVEPEDHGIYRMLIGSAQWIISLGRFDIMYSVSVLSRYCNAPRHGHLYRALRIFGYLKTHSKMSILLDASSHSIPTTTTPVNDVNWGEQYPGVHEELPPDAPTPKGKIANITCYCDSDHAGDLVTRRSTTGILLFVNNTPIKWYSKRQNTIESSTYGSELVSLRIATEFVMEFRYRLRMMGIPIQGASVLLCDNKSSVLNVSLPSSTLKKRHNAIAYHRVRESVAAKIISVHHINGKDNLSDIMTKAVDGTTFKRHTHTTLKKM